MSLVLFALLSTIENMVVFYLTFHMFSFAPKDYWKEIIMMSVVMTLVSFVLRMFDLGVVDVIAQFVMMISVVWWVCRTHPFFALTMSFGSILHVVMQILLMSFLLVTNIFSETYSHSESGAIIVQSVSIVISYSVANLIRIKNWQFSFIPIRNQKPIAWTGINLLVVLLVAVEIACLAFTYSWYSSGFEDEYLIVTLLLFAIAYGILRLLNKKEYIYD